MGPADLVQGWTLSAQKAKISQCFISVYRPYLLYFGMVVVVGVIVDLIWLTETRGLLDIITIRYRYFVLP